MKKENLESGRKLTAEFIAELVKQAAAEALPPAEVARKAEVVGITKAKFDILRTTLLGILAGSFIGLGAMLCTLVVSSSVSA
jgi:formate/nitrite transporter FocA (FNT family)